MPYQSPPLYWAVWPANTTAFAGISAPTTVPIRSTFQFLYGLVATSSAVSVALKVYVELSATEPSAEDTTCAPLSVTIAFGCPIGISTVDTTMYCVMSSGFTRRSSSLSVALTSTSPITPTPHRKLLYCVQIS